MSEFVFVYTTLPDRVSATTLAEALVTAKLAACVNLSALMTSVYEWEGRVEAEPEISALIKTRRELIEPVMEAARKLHPYKVPCFLVLPIESGNADYLAWARIQTEAPKTAD
jgi:periplasmic divalent cation tolerance protein